MLLRLLSTFTDLGPGRCPLRRLSSSSFMCWRGSSTAAVPAGSWATTEPTEPWPAALGPLGQGGRDTAEAPGAELALATLATLATPGLTGSWHGPKSDAEQRRHCGPKPQVLLAARQPWACGLACRWAVAFASLAQALRDGAGSRPFSEDQRKLVQVPRVATSRNTETLRVLVRQAAQDELQQAEIAADSR